MPHFYLGCFSICSFRYHVLNSPKDQTTECMAPCLVNDDIDDTDLDSIFLDANGHLNFTQLNLAILDQLQHKLQKYEQRMANEKQTTYLPLQTSAEYCDRRFHRPHEAEERLLCKFNLDYF